MDRCWFATLLTLCSLQGAAACRPSRPPVPGLSVDEVARRRVEPNVFVIDNNSPAQFARAHLPGARWLHPDRIQPGDLPGDKAATLIFYCANEH